jgi:transcriptional regulator with XRE-family HTH domain
MPDLDNRLREWREEQEYTLAELSALTGYSVPMLSRVERGERRPSVNAKVLIARRLGVDLSRLFPVASVGDGELMTEPA